MGNHDKKNSRSKILTHRQKLWIQVKRKVLKPKYTFNPNSSDNMDFDSIDIKVIHVVVPEAIEVIDWVSAFQFDWSGYRYNDDDRCQDKDEDDGPQFQNDAHIFDGGNILDENILDENILDDNEKINSDYDKMWN